MRKLYGLDLFSGIGGITKALEDWVQPIAYCENNRFCQSVLLSRMASGDVPLAPIWDDVTTLHPDRGWPIIEIVYGGFPCQDISICNSNGKGLEGKQSGLFFEIMRIVDEVEPFFVFMENVPAISFRGLGDVAAQFTKRGYDLRWTTLSAYEVGAPHIRKRWFCLAYSPRSDGWFSEIAQSKRQKKTDTENDGEKESMADPQGVGSDKGICESSRIKAEQSESFSDGKSISDPATPQLQNARERNPTEWRPQDRSCGHSWWEIEPDVDRVVNGLPMWVDRIKSLGNSVVPQQAKTAFEYLGGLRGEME